MATAKKIVVPGLDAVGFSIGSGFHTMPQPGDAAPLPRDLFVRSLSEGSGANSSPLAGLGVNGQHYTTLPMLGSGGTPGTGATSQLVPSGNDLYGLQWHFGYMGDIQTIWDEYSGAGVHVGVYDDGLQTNHPDLQPNYDPSLQVTVEGQIVDPLQSTITYWSPHGTAVAGLIAAANNEIGTVGVAWGAALTGVNIFSFGADINNNYAGFLEAASQTGNFDVTNHSWGKFPGFWQDGVATAQDQSLLDHWFNALETGRGGLGTINVKAAGNADQNSNGDSSGSTRATIAVGAYDDDGDASYYSSYGANLLVSAPSSGVVDFFLGAINKGQVTTDLTEVIDAGGPLPLGYNGLPDDDYTNGFGGTSGATPIVSGVVSLMLDANENLGWRDVQNILAYSAHEIGSGVGGTRLNDENNTWQYNGAGNWNGGGLHYSEDYGFGGVDAYNAVRMAEVWTLFSGPKTSANESSFAQATTDAVTLADGQVTDIQFNFGGADFTVDFVDISIDISHTKLDDLEISLISPDGTVSSLVDFRFELYYTPDLQDATLTFGANGFRGENGTGEWTIRIVDRWLQDEGTVNSASITLHGTDMADVTLAASNDVYHFTDEVFATIARDAARVYLADTNGGTDWLNLSAMTGDILLRMQQGNSSNVGGVTFLRTALGTEIENAVTGDGDDDITGSQGNNTIFGMRGDDTIYAADGNDTLYGGSGNDTLQGGAGNDIFVFDRPLNALTNVDSVVDFDYLYYTETPADRIWLESRVFTGLALGALDADAFAIGTAAIDANDRIIYDALSGALYFDADGLGGSAQVKFAQFDQFATVNNGPHAILSFTDFEVVDTTQALVVGSGADRVQPDAPTTSTSVGTPNLFGDGTPITGTQYNDEILAKDSDESINGLGGDDVLAGGGGNDTINGGAGYDRLFGEDGDDVLRGDDTSTTTTSPAGDELYGDAGNDTLHGSSQQNFLYNLFTSVFAPGDRLEGGDGIDVIYGYDGNDRMGGDDGDDQLYGGAGGDDLRGGNGNDILAGGDGSDIIDGGYGDDVIYAGKGVENFVYGGDFIDYSAPELSIIGFDTVVFEGNFADYDITGGVKFFFGDYSGLMFRNTTVGSALADQDTTLLDWTSIEKLVFADQEIDLVARPMALVGGDLTTSNDYVNSSTPVSMTANGWESIAVVQGAGDVTISDIAAIDELDSVRLLHVNGTTTINSDVLKSLNIGFISGSLTVNAAAGPRALDLRTFALRLDADEQLSDNTATGVSLTFVADGILSAANYGPSIATAGVNGANLSFQAAETIKIVDNESVDVAVRWDIRNATAIDLRGQYRTVEEVNETFREYFGLGNLGIFNILTPLDDSVLSAGGGSGQFQYLGNEIQGNDLIRLGNLGTVNASNDGTAGDEANINAGLGLRGTIQLGGGQDEVRILGSGAFQGGTIDGGFVDPEYGFLEADVIRTTFGVAEAISDISGNISNFEILHLTATGLGHTADATKFDSLSQIVVSSTADADRTNAVTNIASGSTVTLITSGDFDQLSNNLGTIALQMAGTGNADTLSLHFEGIESDGADVGHIAVLGAESVRISGDNLEYRLGETDSLGLPLPPGPDTDPFTGVVLDLQDATRVYVSGETGWDFTTPGTNISNVTLIDGSAVTNAGRLSGIAANAQTASAVTFIGGAGDDVFEGGAGFDTLQGGGGNDTYILNPGSTGDSLVELADGGSDTIRSGLADINLNDFTNIENGELTGNAALSIVGTVLANHFTGNSADNTFTGGAGADTAIFSGSWADYQIERNADGSVTVTDERTTPADGSDTLISVEYLQFSDGRHSVNPLAPTDIVLSNTTTSEASYENILVGTLSAADAEEDTATFQLLDDAGGRFKLTGNEIRTVHHSLIDFEYQPSHNIKVKVTDGDGLTFEKTISISITDFNPEFVMGRDADDIIYGGSHTDILNGRGGNDILRGGGGSDQITGWT
ncbi:MAG: S8 family serine peptidase, partial [Hyphomicrobium sp.]